MLAFETRNGGGRKEVAFCFYATYMSHFKVDFKYERKCLKLFTNKGSFLVLMFLMLFVIFTCDARF